jgi:hypothetical protein
LSHSLIANHRQNNISSEFKAQHTTNIMACPLLENLAPETRNLIYEYVLTFDTPLKHAQKMKPFINKLYQNSDSEAETTSMSSVGPSHVEESLQRVDTALLSTSRLIFKEAILTFYENNTIYLDADDFEVAIVKSPQATDLSLATQVMMKITSWKNAAKSLSACVNGLEFVFEGFPTIFPKLRIAEIYIYTDNSKEPVKTLFDFADQLHRFSDVAFEGVCSFTARNVSQPGIDMRVQYKGVMERWAKEAEEEHGFSWPSPLDMSARAMDRHSQGGQVNRNAIQSFRQMRRAYLPDGYPEVAEGSFEFWTIVDDAFRQTQLLMQQMPAINTVVTQLHGLAVQRIAPTTQLNDASPEKSIGNELGEEDDASNPFEQKPESELGSAQNGAGDQASQKSS